jgi:hypothetical protein
MGVAAFVLSINGSGDENDFQKNTFSKNTVKHIELLISFVIFYFVCKYFFPISLNEHGTLNGVDYNLISIYVLFVIFYSFNVLNYAKDKLFAWLLVIFFILQIASDIWLMEKADFAFFFIWPFFSLVVSIVFFVFYLLVHNLYIKPLLINHPTFPFGRTLGALFFSSIFALTISLELIYLFAH